MKEVSGIATGRATLGRPDGRRATESKEGRYMQEQQEEGAAAACRVLLLEDDEPLRERFRCILHDWPGGRLVAA
jgi:hypothetical protein